MAKLNFLNLSHCNLTDKGLSEFLRISGSQLSKLVLSHTRFTGEVLDETMSLTHLETLELDECPMLSDRGLCQILKISGMCLKTLSVQRTNIIGDNLIEFNGSLTKLETLYLADCGFLADQGFCELLSITGPQLKNLDATGTFITGEGFAEFILNPPSLKYLKLSRCKLTEGGLFGILNLFGRTLKYLDLSVINLTGEGLAGFVNPLPHLEQLTLSMSPRWTEGGLFNLLRVTGPKLKNLCLSYTLVTGKKLSGLQSFNLETLELELCDNLTDRGLGEFLRISGDELTYLAVNCGSITGECLIQLAPQLTRLKKMRIPCSLNQESQKTLFDQLPGCKKIY